MRNKDINEWMIDKGLQPLSTIFKKNGEEVFVSDILEDHLKDQIRLQKTGEVLLSAFLVQNGFTEDNNGHFWINLQTHYLELIPMPDGFYPVIVQIPELSSEDEQRVSLSRIIFIDELERIFLVLGKYLGE